MIGRRYAVLLLSAAVLAACGTDGRTVRRPRGDAAGRTACSRFYDVAAVASAVLLTESEVVAKLRRVGSLAADSTTPAIRETGVRVGEEADARALIYDDWTPAQVDFANACLAFPVAPRS